MRYWRWGLFLCVLFGLACSSNPIPEGAKVQAILVNHTSNQLAQLGHYTKAVKLETHEDALLGSISEIKIDPSNGDLLVADFKVTKKVYRFSAEGKYLNAYGKQGEGPGEYLGLMGFTPLGDGRLVILSTLKMFMFDRDGALLESVRVRLAPYGVQSHGDKIYVHAMKGEDKAKASVMVYDLDFKEVNRFHPYDKRLNQLPFMARNSLAKSSKGLFVSDSYDFRLSAYDFDGTHRKTFDLPITNEDLDPFWTKLKKHRLDKQQKQAFFGLLHRAMYTFAVDDLVYLFEVKQSEDLFRSLVLDVSRGELHAYNGLSLLSQDAYEENLTMEALVGSYDRGLIGYCEDPERLDLHGEDTVLKDVDYHEAENPVILFFELSKPAPHQTAKSKAKESHHG